MIELICTSCKTSNTLADKVGLREECSKCGTDLHSCLHCQFYDRSAYHECRESSADYVKEKDRANFCDYYRPSGPSAADALAKKQQDIKAAAEALFKKKT